MAAYGWTIDPDTATEIIAADFYRDELTVQFQTGKWDGAVTPVYLALGETPEIGKGLVLGNQGCSVRILGAKARLAVNAICEGEATGGIETMTHLEYRHTPNYPGFWNDNDNPEYPKWPDIPK
jgi:hypothetical protein